LIDGGRTLVQRVLQIAKRKPSEEAVAVATAPTHLEEALVNQLLFLTRSERAPSLKGFSYLGLARESIVLGVLGLKLAHIHGRGHERSRRVKDIFARFRHNAECKINKTRFYDRSDWTEMFGKRVRIQNGVNSTREERIQWLKGKKERNIKKGINEGKKKRCG